jgi:hypothetical protein
MMVYIRLKISSQKSRGFLLLVVMGLLTLLLVLCIGFLVAVRSQTNAVMHQRNRTDLINIAYSGLDFSCAQISKHLFDSSDNVRTTRYVHSAKGGEALAWYKDLAANVIANVAGTGAWYKWNAMDARRETKWLYLPPDYILEGGLRARISIQVADTNSVLSVNDWLEDANPTQAQQSHILQGAIGWQGVEAARARWMDKGNSAVSKWRFVPYAPGNNLLRYTDAWRVATQTNQSAGHRTDNYGWATRWDPGLSSSAGTSFETSDALQRYFRSTRAVPSNTTYLGMGGAVNVLAQAMDYDDTSSTFTGMMPTQSCRSYTDPDTGRTPLNVNTCFNSGEFMYQSRLWNTSARSQRDMEGVFNVGALRRIIKVGSFFVNSKTNNGVLTSGIRYLDPYLYPGNQYFQFDATSRLVIRDTQGKPLPKNPHPLNPTLPVELDPLTADTIDPATVTLDPVDGKMSFAKTGPTGRPYVYKSYEDLYAMLNTEEKVQVEKLKTKLAFQYQETMVRYFLASYAGPGNPKYPPTHATVNMTYLSTYTAKLGASEAGKVTHYAKKFDNSAPRFPVSVEDFRTNVKSDLIAMTQNNNAVYAGWTYDSPAATPVAATRGDGGEYVNFDSTDRPEIAAGKLDRRTASAIFDNICPGKRLLYPSNSNPEIKDPIGQLYKRRIGIDEEAINWVEPSRTWSSLTEDKTRVNNRRMNDPYEYFLYQEDLNDNGKVDTGEDLVKYNFTPPYSPYSPDPDTGGPNPNNQLDNFMEWTYVEDAASTLTPNKAMKLVKNTIRVDAMRERGQEVWTADTNKPVKGRDYLSTTGADRFVDENIFFNTSENPINPAAFDPSKPNCLIHPLPMVDVKDSNGAFVSVTQGSVPDFNGNGKFDTIECIPGFVPVSGGPNLNTAQDTNGDGKINTYYRTPERQLIFGSDCFSTELTTTSVCYKIVVTTELCDAASVLRNPSAPIIVAHSEVIATVQLAPDIEGSAIKESQSDYTDKEGIADKANDPGLHYYRTNQPTIRKTRTYDSITGDILAYNVKTGVQDVYDPSKEAQGLQIRGGIINENDTHSDRTSAWDWIDPLGVPSHIKNAASDNVKSDTYRKLYYSDPHQNKRRIVIRDFINTGTIY